MLTDKIRHTLSLALHNRKSKVEQAIYFDPDRRTEDLQCISDAVNWLYAQPTAPEPDWNEAPEWAEWWAVDANEGYYWYEHEPFILAWGWANPKGLVQGDIDMEDRHIPIGIDWRTLKRQRPQ